MLDRRGALIGLMFTAASSALPGERPGLRRAEAVARRAAGDYLFRPDFMRYDVGEVHALHYAEIACAYGVARLASVLRDRDLLERLAARYRRMLAAGLPNSANHVDANVCGIWPLLLARRSGDGAARRAGLALADGQWRSTGADGLTAQARYWIDDIWMIGLLQLEAWRATGEALYRDRAALTGRLYLERLQQPNGLFHHGPEAPFFWGRGNGWVAAGLAEILSDLPRGHGDRPALLAGYRRMMAALLRFQAPGGMWRQLIDHGEAWEESSATAMFGYAMATGISHRLLRGRDFEAAVRRAWAAIESHVGGDGRLSGICVGTGQSADASYYLARPTVTGDLHGQAALLWFVSEVLRR